MRKLQVMVFAMGMVVGSSLSGFCDDVVSEVNDSSGIVPLVTAPVPEVDSLPVVDRFKMFSVDQKKYLKRLAITNALYAAGFGLYHGVVIPRAKKVEGDIESLKLMPLSLLSQAMMYASLPMSVVASRKAEKNYELYHKEGPRNLTLPSLFVGCGAFLGAVGFSYVLVVNDIRDNHEWDGSYTKYEKPLMVCLNTGTIIWAGTNLYSLIYVAALGKKAKAKASLADALELSPWYCNGANGVMVSLKF